MPYLIRGLNPLERLILMLRHCDQLKWNEIADVLGLAETHIIETYLRILKDQMRCLG